MGLFDRLRRSRGPAIEPANTAPDWISAGYWMTWEPPGNVVVESHYQDALYALTGGVCGQGYLIPAPAVLIREPHNPHDPNALRVEIRGRHVGYVRRTVAARLAPALDACSCHQLTVCAVVRGRRADGAEGIGVHLWLSRRCTAGPDFSVTGDGLEVPWPPGEREMGRAITRFPT